MDDMLSSLNDPFKVLEPWQEDIVAGVMVLLALIFCLSGELWFNTLVAVIAAVAGGFAMNVVLSRLQADISVTIAAIIILLASVLCGVIAAWVKSVGIWMAGALGGLLVSNLIYSEIVESTESLDQDWVHILTLFVCALLGGTLLSWLERPLERVITSLVGSYLCVAALSHFLMRAGVSKTQPFWPSQFFGDVQHFECKGDSTCTSLLITWAALFVAGVIWQSLTGHLYNRREGYQQI